MPISADEARRIFQKHLCADENEINNFGSALPGHASKPKTHLMVTREEEYDCGWLFYYDTRESVVDGNISSALAGNWPYIVSRENGSIHSTGRRPIAEYLDQMRNQKKHNQSAHPMLAKGQLG